MEPAARAVIRYRYEYAAMYHDKDSQIKETLRFTKKDPHLSYLMKNSVCVEIWCDGRKEILFFLVRFEIKEFNNFVCPE